MAKDRIGLSKLLREILDSDNVYFQPPESLKMNYPAIVYSRERIDNRFANNNVYKQNRAYKITVIDKNPDSEIVDKISSLPMCTFDRHFTLDNLNHDVFTIYY
jgi:hypothetical protein